ncbi:hypothetical protein K435DRAFT_691952, partial [Dendrothele bispora CBS 962.96]
NGCWLGVVPDPLKGLSFLEEMVIARAHTTKCWGKLGMRNEHGDFPKSNGDGKIKNIANRLPRPFDTLKDQIAVIIVSNDDQVTAKTFQRTPFLVRRQKILDALIWLKANNRFYRDIEIDLEALNNYPRADDLSAPAPFNVHVEHSNSAIVNESTSYTGHSVNEATWDASSSGNMPVLSSGMSTFHDWSDVS